MATKKIRMVVAQDSRVLEEYQVPEGSWINTEHVGMQQAVALKQPTAIWRECTGGWLCTHEHDIYVVTAFA